MSSKKYVQKTSLTDETLEIRVFEAVCLNHRPASDFLVFPKEMLAPKPVEFFAAVMEPIRAVLYAPRAPSAGGSFVLNPKPMSL